MVQGALVLWEQRGAAGVGEEPFAVEGARVERSVVEGEGTGLLAGRSRIILLPCNFSSGLV